MKILIVGYSQVFKRRILPVLDELSFIDCVSIAKYAGQRWDDSYKQIAKLESLYDDYESAFQQFDGQLVYVSSINSSHYGLAKTALRNGFHCIVDKPATMRLLEAEELIRIGTDHSLLISEATVYLYHPQMGIVRGILAEHGCEATNLTVLFSFPLPGNGNFRYCKELGGGAIADTGPYAISVGRFFFGGVPEACFYVENQTAVGDVEISYSLLLKYPNGKSLVGHFGFTTEYVNRLNVLGPRISIDVDRIFTLPENVENPISVRSQDREWKVFAPAASMFKEYFVKVGASISAKSYDGLYSDMLLDAKARDMLSASRENGN